MVCLMSQPAFIPQCALTLLPLACTDIAELVPAATCHVIAALFELY
jgi:hypothetical protein